MSGNVKIVKGDILKSEAQTLVNPVNCVGVMGKGLALEFKKRFPKMYKDYEARCKRAEVKLRRPYLYRNLMPPWIVNFPTKDHWRGVSRLEDIVKGLEYLKDHYTEWGITSMAVPALGCSYGQLQWNVVGPTMYRILSQFDIPIELYVPLDESVEDFKRMLQGKPSADDIEAWRPIIRKATDLFMRVDTQQAEILATVHMVSHDLSQHLERMPTADEVVENVLAWKQKRRPPLNREKVKQAVGQLAILGWIKVKATESWSIDEPELVG